MSNVRPSKSDLALEAALATFGSLDVRTAAFLLYRAAARNLIREVGQEKGSELIYGSADAAAVGGEP